MKKIFQKLFVKKDGELDTFMIVICLVIGISLFFALLHEVLLWISVLSHYHLTDQELRYMHDISFLYAITLISELISGAGYQVFKQISPSKEEGGVG